MFARRALEIAIVFVIGLVLGPLLWRTPDTLPVTTTADRANLATATAFYAAANRFLESGDDAPLVATLDPGFADHSPLGSEPNATGFIRYLTSLRTAYPDLRVEAIAIATHEAVVTVSLVTTQATTAIPGGLVADRETSAPGIELLRIQSGKVAERWASVSLPPQFEQVASIDLLQPAGWFVQSSMERLEFEPGASMTRREALPSLLIVSTGTLSIEVDRAADAETRLLMEQGATKDLALARGVATELLSESVVIVPKLQEYRIWNDRNETAVAIRVEFAYRPPSTTFVNGNTTQIESTNGVVVAAQAGALPTDIDNDRPYRLRLIRIRAAPNQTLPVHSVSGIEQIFVSGGALDVDVYAGSAAVLKQNGVGSDAIEGSHQLVPGGVMIAHPASVLSYQTTGSAPTAIWFVSITSASSPAA